MPEVDKEIYTGCRICLSLNEFESLQIATPPKLTPAPTTYQLINTTQNESKN